MRLLTLALAATVAIGCSSPTAEPKDEGDTASLIVGGTTANIETWPGMAQLETAQGPQCGGTLISPEWVVTAAHCFMDDQPNGSWTRVAFGRSNSTSNAGEIIQVKEAFRHQQFDGQTMVNDIALIHLATKTTRKPAKVITAAEWTSLGKPGTQLTVVGWGAAQEGAQMTTDLRQVSIPLIDHTQCAGMALAGQTLGENMICAGLPQGGKDSCQGDSGGPLFMQIGGAPVQVGIVSFGEGCARAGAPGVYTRIAAYGDWINQNTNNALVPPPPPPPPPVVTTPPPATETDGNADDVLVGGDDDKPSKSTTSSGDDDDDDTEETPAPKKKRKTKKPVPEAQGCAMNGTNSTSSGATSALLVLAAVVAMRRRKKGE